MKHFILERKPAFSSYVIFEKSNVKGYFKTVKGKKVWVGPYHTSKEKAVKDKELVKKISQDFINGNVDAKKAKAGLINIGYHPGAAGRLIKKLVQAKEMDNKDIAGLAKIPSKKYETEYGKQVLTDEIVNNPSVPLATFKIKMLEHLEEVQGYPLKFKGYPNADFFVYKSKAKKWCVGEKLTGLHVINDGYEKTSKVEAITAAKKLCDDHGGEKTILKLIEDDLKQNKPYKKYEPEKQPPPNIDYETAKAILSKPSDKFEELEFIGKLYKDDEAIGYARQAIENSDLRFEDKLMSTDVDYLHKKKARYGLTVYKYLKFRYGEDFDPAEEVQWSTQEIKANGQDALNAELRHLPDIKHAELINRYGEIRDALDGDNWQRYWAEESNDSGGFQDWIQIAAIAKMGAGMDAEVTTGMDKIKKFREAEIEFFKGFERYKVDNHPDEFNKLNNEQKLIYFVNQVKRDMKTWHRNNPTHTKKYFDNPLSSDFIQRFLDIYEANPKFRMKDIESIAEKVHDNIYNRTQKFFTKMGYKPDDEIVVFRGSTGKFFAHQQKFDREGLKKNPVIKSSDYTTRPLTSFSLSPGTAFNFSGSDGIVIATKVKIKDVFSHFASGFGCRGESEVVLKNEGLKSDIKVVWVGKED